MNRVDAGFEYRVTYQGRLMFGRSGLESIRHCLLDAAGRLFGAALDVEVCFAGTACYQCRSRELASRAEQIADLAAQAIEASGPMLGVGELPAAASGLQEQAS